MSNCALKPRHCVFKTRHCVLKTRHCVLKPRHCVFKMMNSAVRSLSRSKSGRIWSSRRTQPCVLIEKPRFFNRTWKILALKTDTFGATRRKSRLRSQTRFPRSSYTLIRISLPVLWLSSRWLWTVRVTMHFVSEMMHFVSEMMHFVS